MDDAFISAVLHRMMSRRQWAQVYLFGAEGEPFWAARLPLRQHEILLLSNALDLIEKVEQERPKPFVAFDHARRFAVGALDAKEDLYVVLVAPEPSGADAIAWDVEVGPIAAARADLLPHVAGIRARLGSAGGGRQPS